MIHASHHGLSTLSDADMQVVVAAVRAEIAELRWKIHRLRRVDRCDLSVVVGHSRPAVSGDCLCAELLIDMLGATDRFLAVRTGPALRNLAGAVRIHVRVRAKDWTRLRRARSGAQARTDRLRGGIIGRSLPDAYHRAVLQYLADEAGSIAPLGDEAALHRRLAELLAGEFGGTVEEHLPRMLATLSTVERTCRATRKVAGFDRPADLVTWWERYIWEPLGRRDPLDRISLDEDGVADGISATDPDPADRTAVAVVLRFAAELSESPQLALSEAIAELVRQGLLDAPAAHRFLADPGRVRDAVEQVDLLLAA